MEGLWILAESQFVLKPFEPIDATWRRVLQSAPKWAHVRVLFTEAQSLNFQKRLNNFWGFFSETQHFSIALESLDDLNPAPT